MSSTESIPTQVVQLQVLLGATLERIGQLLKRIGQLKERNAQLEEENAQLRERLGQNSTNSSKPPSEDPPGTVRLSKKKKRRGRRPGGQPGHPKHERVLAPAEQVQRVVEVLPERCKRCQRRLSGRDATPERHQVVELPPVAAQVTEYRCHQLECTGCGTRTRAEVPPEARSTFGERLGGLVCLLVGKYRLSKRLVTEALSDIVGVKLSVGSVANLEQEMSAALEGPMAEAEEYVSQADAVNVDETGWKEGVKAGRAARAWLWVFATALVVVFRIGLSRGGRVPKQVLGEHFTGFLISDRWVAYEGFDSGLRQLCWSHLTRDFQGFIERGGVGGRIGTTIPPNEHQR